MSHNRIKVRKFISLMLLLGFCLLNSNLVYAINKPSCVKSGKYGSRTSPSAGSKPCRSHVSGVLSSHHTLSVATGAVTTTHDYLISAQHRLTVATGKLNQATTAVTTSKTNLATAQGKLSTAQQTLNTQRGQNQTAAEQMRIASNAHQQAVRAVNNSGNIYINRYTSGRVDPTIIAADLAQLKSQSNSFNYRVEGGAAAVALLQRVVNANNAMSAAQAKLQSTSQAIESTQRSITTYTAHVDQLTNAVSTAKNNLANQQNAVNDARSQVTEAQGAYSNAQSALQEAHANMQLITNDSMPNTSIIHASNSSNVSTTGAALTHATTRLATVTNTMSHNTALNSILSGNRLNVNLASKPTGYLEDMITSIQDSGCYNCTASNMSQAVGAIQAVIVARAAVTAAQGDAAAAQANNVSVIDTRPISTAQQLASQALKSGSGSTSLGRGRASASHASSAALAKSPDMVRATAAVTTAKTNLDSTHVAAAQVHQQITQTTTQLQTAQSKLNTNTQDLTNAINKVPGTPRMQQLHLSTGEELHNASVTTLRNAVRQTANQSTINTLNAVITLKNNLTASQAAVTQAQNKLNGLQTSAQNIAFKNALAQTSYNSALSRLNSARIAASIYGANYQRSARLARNYNEALRIYHNTVNASNLAASRSAASLGNSTDNRNRMRMEYLRQENAANRRPTAAEKRRAAARKRRAAARKRRDVRRRKTIIENNRDKIEKYKAIIRKHEMAVEKLKFGNDN